MSRSLGDKVAHTIGVSSEPDIYSKELNLEEDRFIIIGTDGIWEFMSNEVAVGMVASSWI